MEVRARVEAEVIGVIGATEVKEESGVTEVTEVTEATEVTRVIEATEVTEVIGVEQGNNLKLLKRSKLIMNEQCIRVRSLYGFMETQIAALVHAWFRRGVAITVIE